MYKYIYIHFCEDSQHPKCDAVSLTSFITYHLGSIMKASLVLHILLHHRCCRVGAGLRNE